MAPAESGPAWAAACPLRSSPTAPVTRGSPLQDGEGRGGVWNRVGWGMPLTPDLARTEEGS